MHAETGVSVEPSTDRGMLMGGVIVGDDVDVEIGRGLLIDGFEKGEPLLVAMARRQAGDQLALQGARAVLRREITMPGAGAHAAGFAAGDRAHPHQDP